MQHEPKIGQFTGIIAALALIAYVGLSGAVADLFFPEREACTHLAGVVAQSLTTGRPLVDTTENKK